MGLFKKKNKEPLTQEELNIMDCEKKSKSIDIASHNNDKITKKINSLINQRTRESKQIEILTSQLGKAQDIWSKATDDFLTTEHCNKSSIKKSSPSPSNPLIPSNPNPLYQKMIHGVLKAEEDIKEDDEDDDEPEDDEDDEDDEEPTPPPPPPKSKPKKITKTKVTETQTEEEE